MNNSKQLSPMHGVLFFAVVVGITWGLPRMFIPKWQHQVNGELMDSKQVIEDVQRMSQTYQASQKKFTGSFGEAYDVVGGLQFPTSAQLYDKLLSASRSIRRSSPINVNLALTAARGQSDPMSPLVGFLYPGLQMQQFNFTIQGPLSDVVDFLRREVETQPFYLYGSMNITLGSAGDWPRYSIQVWLPVSAS